MTNKLLTISITVITLIALSGCEGPAGPMGERGPQGESGNAGPQGPDGNANVISVTKQWNDSEYECGDEDCTYGYVQFSLPELTADMVNSAAVLAYYNTSISSANGWIALPLTTQYYEFTYIYAAGEFLIAIYSLDGLSILLNDLPEGSVKITIVPEGTQNKISADVWNNRVKQPGIPFKLKPSK